MDKTNDQVKQLRQDEFLGPSSRTSPPQAPEDLSLISDDFLSILGITAASCSSTLEIAGEWYSAYFIRKLTTWPSLATETQEGSVSSRSLTATQKRNLDTLLHSVLRKIQTRNTKLTTVIEAVCKSGLLISNTNDRREEIKFALSLIGWFTMSFNGSAYYKAATKLSEYYRSANSTEILYTQPLHELLVRSTYIEIEPLKALKISAKDLIPEVGSLPPFKEEGATRFAYSLLCFKVLESVGNVNIQWVDLVSQHMRFNPDTKVLSIFKFPSYAFLMAVAAINQSNSNKINKTLIPICGEMPNRESLGYFREVLLTYHILFGHDKTSRALFTRVGPTLSRDPIADPLLPIFCGQGSSKLSRDIYEEVYIDTSAKSSQFSAFPLFGERILRLEAHIKSCRPEAFSATWYDKTIASTWVTYWLTILGAFTLLFAALLGIFNSFYSYMLSDVWESVSVNNMHYEPRYVSAVEGGDVYEFSFDSEPWPDDLAIIAYEALFVTGTITILLAPVAFLMIWPAVKSTFGTYKLNHPPAGSIRVNWQCSCGQSLHDDVLEMVPGAAKVLVTDLNAESSAVSESTTTSSLDIESQILQAPSKSHSLESRISTLTGVIFNQTRKKRRKTDDDIPDDHDIREGTHKEPLYLLLLIERGDGSMQLHQENVAEFKSDRELFTRLRHMYRKARGRWLPSLSLRSLQSINFVQFELWSSGDVDVLQYFDHRMLPPKERLEYNFQRTDTLPPIAPNRLMHFWNTPEHPNGSGTTCLSRIPKKRNEKLCVSESGCPARAWGIHLAESWDWTLIMILVLLIFLGGSLTFGIAYALSEHDLQSAFAVSSYVVSFAALSIGACSICCRKIGNASAMG